MKVGSCYYDASYFEWQCPGGELSAILDRWKFEPFVRESDTVLDFGCGGGFLLGALPCRQRFGIEVNASAREKASALLNVHAEIEDLPDNLRFDVIISHHALEHVDRPLDVIRQLASRLNATGKCVFVVPSESWHAQRSYCENDINQHIYTWTPQALGNLFTHAGLHVKRVDLLCHRWLPLTHKVYRRMPPHLYHALCQLWAFVSGTRQIRIVATTTLT